MIRFPFSPAKLAILLTAATVAVTGFSCRPFIGIKQPYTPYDVQGVVPQTFLYTKYAPLNQFLDTPVYVQIDEVSLDQVFSHPALQPLNYRFSRKPVGKMPIVSIHQLGLTRRQLLWGLAKDYQLQMFPVLDPYGSCFIEIRANRQSLLKEPEKAALKTQ
jgi:hypothetical protein